MLGNLPKDFLMSPVLSQAGSKLVRKNARLNPMLLRHNPPPSLKKAVGSSLIAKGKKQGRLSSMILNKNDGERERERWLQSIYIRNKAKYISI